MSTTHKTMIIRKFKFVRILLIPLLVFFGCEKEKNDEVNKEELCLYFNSENLDKTTPIINNYLSELADNLGNEQKLQALTEWLKSHTCINDASILCVSCIYTLLEQSEISISFEEDGETKKIILDILMSNPLRAIGYHEHY